MLVHIIVIIGAALAQPPSTQLRPVALSTHVAVALSAGIRCGGYRDRYRAGTSHEHVSKSTGLMHMRYDPSETT